MLKANLLMIFVARFQQAIVDVGLLIVDIGL